jgi:hypothetical protein
MGCFCSKQSVVDDSNWEVNTTPAFAMEYLQDPENWLDIIPSATNLVEYSAGHFSIEGTDTGFVYHFRDIITRDIHSTFSERGPAFSYEVSVTTKDVNELNINNDRMVSYDVAYEFLSTGGSKRSYLHRRVTNYVQWRFCMAPAYVVLLRMIGIEKDNITKELNGM